MAAAGIGNPLGAVMLFDGGAPRIITGYAIENISGGVFVFASGAADCVSSGAESFSTSDIWFTGEASGTQFTGIALQDTASGLLLPVATRGTFIVECSADTGAAMKVKTDGLNTVEPCAKAEGGDAIGRALTRATSGTLHYIVIDLHG
jgi:hypothetical protein